MLLEVRDLEVYYGHIQALSGISFDVAEGEIVCMIGANGAGKTTTLRTISRLIPATNGAIAYRDRLGHECDLFAYEAHDVAGKLGITHVPEGRHIFGNLTVMENLELATYARRDREAIKRDLDRVFTLWPRLAERRGQRSETLSGGEQQMLAVARALMTRGQLMLLDEPSMGLAPVLMQELFRTLEEINAAGTTILLVEQNAHAALKLASRGYVLETGSIVLAGNSADLLADPEVKRAYLGA